MMSLPKAKSTGDLQHYERVQKRLLSNELKELDAIKSQKEKHMTRNQMEIRRDLWKLLEDKKRILSNKSQRGEALSSVSLSVGQAVPAIKRRSPKATLQVSFRGTSPIVNRTVGRPNKPMTEISSSQNHVHLQSQYHSHTRTTNSKPSRDQSVTPLPKLLASPDSPVNQNKSYKTPLRSSGSDIHKRGTTKDNSLEEVANAYLESSSSTAMSKTVSVKKKIYKPGHPTALSTSSHVEENPDERFLDSVQITREKTEHHLTKQFLSKEGIALSEIPNLILLTEEIIAMRNLGKSNDDIWNDVRNCRYLRGYEPPIMVIPGNDPNPFVFGKSSSELYQQHLLRIAQQVEEVQMRRQAEADTATYTLPSKPRRDDAAKRQQYKNYMKHFL